MLAARHNLAVLIVNLLPLMSFFQKTREEMRERNSDALVRDLKEWVCASASASASSDFPGHGKIDCDRIVLIGHSAGSAVALETACKLQDGFNNRLKGVLLLDGVPWMSTVLAVQRSSRLRSFFPPFEVTKKKQQQAHDDILVTSIRGEQSLWNAGGLILEVLARGGMGRETPTGVKACDILVKDAKHGDFMCEIFTPPVVSPMQSRVGVLGMRAMNLLSTQAIQEDIQSMIGAWCDTIFLSDSSSSSFKTVCEALVNSKRLKVELVGNDDVPSDLTKSLPHFLL